MQHPRIVVLVSADAEWAPVRAAVGPATVEASPYGEFFTHSVGGTPVVFVHGGWGKIAAAGSTEHAIARWQPHLLINIGTCGGVEGRVDRGETLLVTRTVTYDVAEAMGDYDDGVRAYTTDIDLRWLGAEFPLRVRRAALVSADRDLVPADIPALVERHDAIAADWESSAIAWVARRHGLPLLILRTVSDLVSADGGEAIGNLSLFSERAAQAMQGLLGDLPVLLPFLQQRLKVIT